MIIKNILIGEDIRQELGNKLSIMGIFGSSINIEVPPNVSEEPNVKLTLACLISIERTDLSSDPSDFKILIEMLVGDKKLGTMTANIEAIDLNRIFHIPTPRIEFAVTASTKLTVNVQAIKNDTLVSENTATMDINVKRGK